jgi:hypothetical protein
VYYGFYFFFFAFFNSVYNEEPRASSGVSSVEKKKSYGLFSFYTGGLHPAIIGVEIESPQGAGY